MKQLFFAMAVVCVFALAAFAQKTPDFSGKWSLDLAKSKLTDREKQTIEAQTITVTQTATDIKIETDTKRVAPPGGGGGGGMGSGRGGGMGGPQTFLLGKEATADQQVGPNTVPVTAGSKWDGTKLVTTRSFTFNGPNGEVKSVTKQTFELGADGKTLTVTVESTGMQGTTTSTRVYSKA